VLAVYPFLEAWLTNDHEYHNLLDRPRNRPNRTAIGMAMMALYIILFLGGGNDIIADKFDMSINVLTRIFQVSLFVVPPLVFVITKRICYGLQRRDHDTLHHGHESGTIKMLPSGEFVELHVPAGDNERIFLVESTTTSALPQVDEAVKEQRAQDAITAGHVRGRGYGNGRRSPNGGPAAALETTRRKILAFFYEEKPAVHEDEHDPTKSLTP
jgi:ubiquinol-cytochrome c reductase cytochrome b subunit